MQRGTNATMCTQYTSVALFTFKESGLRLGRHLCRDSGRLWICVWVKNTTLRPISEAAVTAASSSTARLTRSSPTSRVLQVGGEGRTVDCFLTAVADEKVLNTRSKTSAMCEL